MIQVVLQSPPYEKNPLCDLPHKILFEGLYQPAWKHPSECASKIAQKAVWPAESLSSTFVKPQVRAVFVFLNQRKQRRATTGPSASFQPRRPDSTLKRPWNRSDRPQNLVFPGLRAENTSLDSLRNRLQRKLKHVSAGRGSVSFSSRAVPYIDHKSFVRLALPKQDPSAGPEIHPSGLHELSRRSRRHLTASVTAWKPLRATDTRRPYVLKREGPYSSI